MKAPAAIVKPEGASAAALANVEAAIQDIAEGRLVILVDDEDRENEGDLCMAAEKVTPEAINFMARFGRGLICLTLTEERIGQLDLPMMVERNTSPYQTGFTVSIEASRGVTTGISARDRAHTILTAVADGAAPKDLVRPGHVFPIRARNGGVLVRTGQTEGSVDLARLAGLRPAGVICEIMNEDGTMARRPELEGFAEEHKLRIVTIAELIEYRFARESLVEVLAEREVETPEWGTVRVLVMRSITDDKQHIVLVKGEVRGEVPVLTRVQSIELPSDLVGLAISGGGAEMRAAMRMIADAGSGVFVYLVHQDTAEASLSEKLARVQPGLSGRVGKRMDLREFGIGAQVLKAVGVRRFKLLSNHDVRIVGIEGYDLEMVERIPLPLGELGSERR